MKSARNPLRTNCASHKTTQCDVSISRQTCRRRRYGAALLTACLATSAAYANDIRWIVTTGTAGFSNSGNWQPNTIPGTGDVADFQTTFSNPGNTYSVNFGSSVTNQGVSVHRDTVTWNLGGSQTYTQTGVANASSFVVGTAAGETGRLTLNGGMVSTSDSSSSYWTSLGQVQGAFGFVTLSGSAGNYANWTDSADERIGDGGTGNLTLSSFTTHTVGAMTTNRNLYLAYSANSSGTVTVNNNATMTVYGNAFVGGSSTSQGGTGSLSASGNLSVTGGVTIYAGSSASLTGGSLTTPTINDSGAFTHSGGALSITTFNLNAGGSATLANAAVPTFVGPASGSASLNVSNFCTLTPTSFTLAGTLNFGAATAGTLNLTSPNISGTLNINGGTVALSGTGTGTGAIAIGGTGALTGTGATTAAITVNSGGTLTPGNTSLTVSALTLNTGAVLTFAPGNSLTVSGNNALNLAGPAGISLTGAFTPGTTLIHYNGAVAGTADPVVLAATATAGTGYRVQNNVANHSLDLVTKIIGTQQAIALSGQAEPGGGTFTAFESNPTLNDLGQSAFTAHLAGAIDTSLSGVFVASGNSIYNILRAHEINGTGGYMSFAAPSLSGNGHYATFLAQGLLMTWTDQGLGLSSANYPGNYRYSTNAIYYPAPVANDGSAAFRSDPGVFGPTGVYRLKVSGDGVPIAVSGQTSPGGGGSYTSFTDPWMNNSGVIAFSAVTSSGGGVFKTTDGSNTPVVVAAVVLAGSAAPGGGAFTAAFGSPAINDNNQVAFYAGLTSPTSAGIFRSDGSSTALIARQGQVAPGGGTFSILNSTLAMSSGGVVAFASTLANSGSTGGLFLGDSIENVLVAQNGQTLSGKTISTLSMGTGSINTYGQFAYRATFTDASSGLFTFTPTLYWRSSGNGNWSDSTNWTLGITPASMHDVIISPATPRTINGPTNSPTIKSLTLGGGGAAVTLQHSAGTTLHVMGSLTVAGDNSTFVLANNSSLAINGDVIVGATGTGNFTHTGGTYGTKDTNLYLGYNAASTGNYALSGTGSFTSGGSEYVGYNGTGTFTQSGGMHELDGAFTLGFAANSSGAYNLSDTGSLVAYCDETIAGQGTGNFTQTGGTHTVNGGHSIKIAAAAGATGTYTISGGSATLNGGGSVALGQANSSGTAVLNVSNSGTLTITGFLDVHSTAPGTGVNLNGGTINAAGLSFYGVPSVLHWTAGTLNITNSVTFDPAADPTDTATAFGAALTVGNNQTLMITGNETLGGAAAFGLTLAAGGSHYVAGTLTLSPTGTITQDPAATLYAATIIQAGGAVNGTLQNQGNFIYQSGQFNGRLLNQGTVNLGPFFTAGDGIENDASMTVAAGQTVTANGAGMDNLGTLTLAGGTLAGNGYLTNDFGGVLQARGTINSQLINNGTLTVTGVLRLNSSGNANYGIVQGSGTIMGSIENTTGGIIQTTGLAAPLALTRLQNDAGGTIQVAPSSTLNINNPWTNSGLVTLQGAGAVLGGDTITNTATIQGAGTISVRVLNTGGVIRASGGQLALAGAGNTSDSTSQIQASTGATVLYNQGLATNEGTIALAGGTFDNNNHPMTNTGTISGNGVVRTGGLTNDVAGTIRIADAPTSVYGSVTNNGSVQIVNTTATFYGFVDNTSGTIKTTSATARYLGGASVGGTYTSDPSTNIFTALTVTPTGTVTGGVGDVFNITSGTLTNSGTFTSGGTLIATAVVNAGTMNLGGTATVTTLQGTAAGSHYTGITNVTVSGALTADCIRQDTLTVAAGATARVRATATPNSSDSVSVISALTIANAAGVYTGSLDLNDNALVVQGGTLATISAMAAAGYHGGHWNGTGLTSSDAATLDPSLNHGLGVLTAAEALAEGGPDFAGTDLHGQHVASADVLVQYGWNGDVNFDGAVNYLDYGLIDNAYLTPATPRDYAHGDLNFDGAINYLDYGMMDNAYLAQTAPHAAAMTAAGAAAASSSAVPEPAGLALLALSALPVLKRRRRR